MENAIHRMTGASAARFRLKDRGILAPGKYADVTVFDAGIVAEKPGEGEKPAGKPDGIRHVFINGEHIIEAGHFNNRRAGQVLRV